VLALSTSALSAASAAASRTLPSRIFGINFLPIDEAMVITTTNLAAFALLVATTAFAQEAVAKSCEGKVASTDGKVTVGKCWTNNAATQELIAMACGEGDKCEVYGDFTRAGEITRFGFATGPKGMSFKMKQCKSCIEGLDRVLRDKRN
jgi:hypothetical protein